MRGFWTEERCEIVRTLRARGMSVGKMAAHMGVSKSAISGIVFRLGLTPKNYKKPNQKPREEWSKLPARRMLNADIKPSLTPFAPDDTCPDFAWDDDHCAAVLAKGGYPVLQLRRAA